MAAEKFSEIFVPVGIYGNHLSRRGLYKSSASFRCVYLGAAPMASLYLWNGTLLLGMPKISYYTIWLTNVKLLSRMEELFKFVRKNKGPSVQNIHLNPIKTAGK